MLKKVIFGSFLLFSIYSSISLVQELSSEKYDIGATSYFNQKDSTVYVIHGMRGIDFNPEVFMTLAENSDLIQSIKESIPEDCSIYFSKNRPVLIFESKSNWSKSSIKDLFINGKFKVQFTKLREFKYGSFVGEYSKNKVLVYSGKKPNSFKTKFELDKKSNYSIVSLQNDLPCVHDYYLSREKSICYTKLKEESNPLMNQSDQEIFSSLIPQDFENYTFYEKEYLASIDSVYRNSILYDKTASGLLVLQKAETSLIVIDVKRGQNIIQDNESVSDSEINFMKQKKSFFSWDEGHQSIPYYFMSDINDFAILSKDKSYFDQNLTEIKLGNVLLKNKEKLDGIYENTPKKVVFRNSNPRGVRTISKVRTSLIETNLSYSQSTVPNGGKHSKNYFAMNTEERIVSFYAYAGRGNTFLVTDSNTWIKFENGIRKWDKTFNKKVLKRPKLMEMSSNQHQDVSILFKDTLLIIDKEGRILNYFKTSGAVHPIRCRIKSNVCFLIPNTNRMEVLDYDGKVLSTYSFSSDIKDMVIFNEKGKKHVAVLCDKMFFIINLNRKKTVRKTKLSGSYKLIKLSEKSVILNTLQSKIIDVLGNEINCAVPNGFEYKCSYRGQGSIHLLFAKDNVLLSIGEQGQYEWKKTIACSSIDKLVVHKTQSTRVGSGIILGVLDGIENKILLLNSMGSMMDDVKRHGEKDLQITDYGNRGISITTFLGNYLIQYAKF